MTKLALRIRLWWHRIRRHHSIDHRPNDVGSICTDCTCGGYGIWRPENGRAVVIVATCWAFEAVRIEQRTLPISRIVGGAK